VECNGKCMISLFMGESLLDKINGKEKVRSVGLSLLAWCGKGSETQSTPSAALTLIPPNFKQIQSDNVRSVTERDVLVG